MMKNMSDSWEDSNPETAASGHNQLSFIDLNKQRVKDPDNMRPNRTFEKKDDPSEHDHKTEFLYATNDGEAIIRSYIGSKAHVVIPEEIEGCVVIGIGNNAFENNSIIRSVTLPINLQTIGDKAFNNCKNLKSVVFSKQIMQFLRIGKDAFAGCNINTPIVLNACKLDIGCDAFSLNYDIPFILLLSNDIVFRDYPFRYCKSVKFVYMYPDAFVNYIGTYLNSNFGDVFANMENLEKAFLQRTRTL